MLTTYHVERPTVNRMVNAFHLFPMCPILQKVRTVARRTRTAVTIRESRHAAPVQERDVCRLCLRNYGELC